MFKKISILIFLQISLWECLSSHIDNCIYQKLERFYHSSHKILLALLQHNKGHLTQQYISHVIKNIHDNDQNARKLILKLHPSDREEILKKVVKMDRINSRIIKIILSVVKAGWLKISVYGKEIDNMCWILVQHMSDIIYQKKILKILKTLKVHNETDKKNYAYLYDRIKIKTGKKTIIWHSSNL